MSELNVERWGRLRGVLERALELAPGERAVHLDTDCAGDPELRAEVEALLAQEEAAEAILVVPDTRRSPVLDAPSGEADAGLAPGTRVGPFEIEQRLAHGGMSVVYTATQETPARRVALKMLRAAVATSGTRRRFRYESEILARLSHPHVAHVYDAGLWTDGGNETPWFALELVEGARPITTYAVEEELTLVERLRLFLDVCDAVHHGHQKGVIHRDLKPGNVLVDCRGRVKVIDFGIARVSSAAGASGAPGLTAASGLTHTGEILGTLAYMAPEQLQGSPDEVDVRADVYALGVVLHELVARELPLDVRGRPLSEVAQHVTERAPIPLRTACPGAPAELEWIALRCLEKEPARRYASASELTSDVRRFLQGETVSSGPPSKLYAWSRFARRNRIGVAAVVAVLAVLTGWAVTSNVLRIRAQESEELKDLALQKADRRLRSLERIQAFLDETLLSVDASKGGRNVKLVDVLRETSQTLGDGEELPPDVAVHLFDSLGRAFYGLGEFDAAVRHLERALEDLPSAEDLGARGREDVRLNLARAYYELARNADAEREARAVLDARKARGATGGLIEAAVVVAQALSGREAWGEAQEVLASLEHVAGGAGDRDPEAELLSGAIRTKMLFAAGELPAADELGREVLAGTIELFGPRHPRTIESLERLGEVLLARHDAAGAQRLLREAYDLRLALYGSDSIYTSRTANNLAVVLGTLGDHAREEELLRACLASMEGTLAADHVDLLNARSNLASCLSTRGRHAESAEMYVRALEGVRSRWGARSVSYLIELNNAARALQRGDELDGALVHFAELADLLPEVLDDGHYLAATFRLNHARALVVAGFTEEARAALDLAHASFLAQEGEGLDGLREVRRLKKALGVPSR